MHEEEYAPTEPDKEGSVNHTAALTAAIQGLTAAVEKLAGASMTPAAVPQTSDSQTRNTANWPNDDHDKPSVEAKKHPVVVTLTDPSIVIPVAPSFFATYQPPSNLYKNPALFAPVCLVKEPMALVQQHGFVWSVIPLVNKRGETKLAAVVDSQNGGRVSKVFESRLGTNEGEKMAFYYQWAQVQQSTAGDQSNEN